MFGVMRETFESEGGSISGDEDFFSVARTIPLVAVAWCYSNTCKYAGGRFALPLIPSAVTPWLTAFNAYSRIRF